MILRPTGTCDSSSLRPRLPSPAAPSAVFPRYVLWDSGQPLWALPFLWLGDGAESSPDLAPLASLGAVSPLGTDSCLWPRTAGGTWHFGCLSCLKNLCGQLQIYLILGPRRVPYILPLF